MLLLVRIEELKGPDEAIKRLLHETFLLRLDQAHLMIKKVSLLHSYLHLSTRKNTDKKSDDVCVFVGKYKTYVTLFR